MRLERQTDDNGAAFARPKAAKDGSQIDRKTAKRPKNDRILEHGGNRYRLVLDRGVWRLRSRHRDHAINFSTGVGNLAMARDAAIKRLDDLAAGHVKSRSATSLQDLVDLYRDIPKKAGVATEKLNVTWLTAIVRDTLGKTLADARIDEAGAKLWRDYAAMKHGGKLDLATRRRENTTINTAIRCARSIFMKGLRPDYKERGVTLADDVTTVKWLPEIETPPAEVDTAALDDAWARLKESDLAMWLTVGIARYSGLRQEEIAAMRGDWLSERKGQAVILLQDRPEQGFLSKTGKAYHTYVLHPELLAMLRSVSPNELVVRLPEGVNRKKWFDRAPQAWLRPFMPKVRKPLHRLRGLYADHLASMTEDAQLARMAGIKKASEALGHTTTATTTGHYLSDR